MNNTQNFNGNTVPMFLPTNMEQPMASNDQTQQNKVQEQQAELSVFDVKELYDMAYAHQENDDAKFKALLAEAVKMDMVYRRQLASLSSYQDRSKEIAFNTAGNTKTA